MNRQPYSADISPNENSRIRRCRASVQTDSLIVSLDLSRVTSRVAKAFQRLLALPNELDLSGIDLSPQNYDDFQKVVVQEFSVMAVTSELDALEFATLVSAFIHECRHVHDLKATRIGAELLLYSLQIYAGAGQILDRLAEWRSSPIGGHIPLPILAQSARFAEGYTDVIDSLRLASEKNDQLTWIWNTRSQGPTIPGHTIRELFETLGFFVQIEWLASTFGGAVANKVIAATVGASMYTSNYLSSIAKLAALSHAYGNPFDPELHDISYLIISALNLCGLDEAFSSSGLIDKHPGVWCDHFGQWYGRLSGLSDVPSTDRAAISVQLTLEQCAIPSNFLIEANNKIRELQQIVLSSLSNPWKMEAILIATEPGIEFVQMHQIISERADYHTPMGYVDLLVSGELPRIAVRVRQEDGRIGDFRTASWIPSNHIGGSRVASDASHQMRILLNGRRVKEDNILEQFVFDNLRAPRNAKGYPEGRGLSFRIT